MEKSLRVCRNVLAFVFGCSCRKRKGGQRCPEIKCPSHAECRPLRGKREFDFSLISVSPSISCSTTTSRCALCINNTITPLQCDKTMHAGFIMGLTTTARTPIDTAATPLWKNLLHRATSEPRSSWNSQEQNVNCDRVIHFRMFMGIKHSWLQSDDALPNCERRETRERLQ